MSTPKRTFDFDVCLSFAGEQRDYVEQVANLLKMNNVRVFYDRYEQASLWGKDLYEHLNHVYRDCARYCVIFVSTQYAGKQWTSHERKSAQARAVAANAEYILPARFDDTELPGLNSTVGYIDLRTTEPAELVSLLLSKLEGARDTILWPEISHHEPTIASNSAARPLDRKDDVSVSVGARGRTFLAALGRRSILTLGVVMAILLLFVALPVTWLRTTPSENAGFAVDAGQSDAKSADSVLASTPDNKNHSLLFESMIVDLQKPDDKFDDTQAATKTITIPRDDSNPAESVVNHLRGAVLLSPNSSATIVVNVGGRLTKYSFLRGEQAKVGMKKDGELFRVDDLLKQVTTPITWAPGDKEKTYQITLTVQASRTAASDIAYVAVDSLDATLQNENGGR